MKKSTFPIVGLGASAGGLQAFQQFFLHTPADTGMAFILTSHLDPDQPSLLAEILQHNTIMPVLTVEDKMVLSPNTVYVMPPNAEMTIRHGKLHLNPPPQNQRMPIDTFLRSLADDQEDNAIGILLSGMGSDGTLGLRAIEGAGGICIVQDPTEALYDGMPRSVIQAGFTASVLPVDKMPEHLQTAVLNRSSNKELPADLRRKAGTVNQVLMQVRASTGHDFTQYKQSTIGRRIERYMAAHSIQEIDLLVPYLKEHPEEIEHLFKELLVNVTSFFRAPTAFAVLKSGVIPLLLKDKSDNPLLRIWVAGCSTGEEAYSIAMIMHEFMEESLHAFKVQIYSTDIAEDVIAKARTGIYPPNIAQDITAKRLSRFFIKVPEGYRVKKEIREMIIFACQNIIKDPPFTKLDLISCRNLLIYLEQPLQDRAIPTFHYALRPGGVLFLSPSESIGSYTDLFTPIDRKWKFYRATESRPSMREFPTRSYAMTATGQAKHAETHKMPKDTSIAELSRKALLFAFAPASVVTDIYGNILYVHNDTGKYLRPAPGQATLNVVEMARDGLQLALRSAINAASRSGAAPHTEELTVKVDNHHQRIHLSVRPMEGADPSQRLLLIGFQEIPTSAAEKRRLKRAPYEGENERLKSLERELAFVRENLQSTIEEEQSANEELQAMNEELQSSNEELETSKEELQSLNEELLTVNAELHTKIEELVDIQNDMKNLLDNINVGIVILNGNLMLRRYTLEATRIFRFAPTDVGRPLNDIKSDIAENIVDEAGNVLQTLIPWERELRTLRGDSYMARIMPYRTFNNVIDGVVMTFTDINRRFAAEQAVQAAREMAENIIDTVREPMLVLNNDLKVVSASGAFYRFFSVKPDDTLNQSIFTLCHGLWHNSPLRDALESVLPTGNSFGDIEINQPMPNAEPRHWLLNGRRVLRPNGETQLILLSMQEIIPAPPSQDSESKT